MFQLTGHEPFLTTVGKLNFFRWAIEKGIMDYIKMNYVKIEKEMNSAAREFQRIRKETNSTQSTVDSTTSSNTIISSTVSTKSSTRRRTRLATGDVPQNISKIMEKHEVTVEVRFD